MPVTEMYARQLDAEMHGSFLMRTHGGAGRFHVAARIFSIVDHDFDTQDSTHPSMHWSHPEGQSSLLCARQHRQLWPQRIIAASVDVAPELTILQCERGLQV